MTPHQRGLSITALALVAIVVAGCGTGTPDVGSSGAASNQQPTATVSIGTGGGVESASPTVPAIAEDSLGPTDPEPDTAPPDPDTNIPTARAGKASTASCINVGQPRAIEVCFAYVANCSYMARLPFYKLATSTNQDWAQAAREHLTKRYQDSALAYLQAQLTRPIAWPPTSQLIVSPALIHIDSVTITPNESSATLHTTETWSVRTTSGQVLFAEQNRPHTITMKRIPSYVLHKWVVTAIS